MRRRIARFFFVFLLGTVATVLGVVTSMTLTPPGRNLLARTVSRELAVSASQVSIATRQIRQPAMRSRMGRSFSRLELALGFVPGEQPGF